MDTCLTLDHEIDDRVSVCSSRAETLLPPLFSNMFIRMFAVICLSLSLMVGSQWAHASGHWIITTTYDGIGHYSNNFNDDDPKTLLGHYEYNWYICNNLDMSTIMNQGQLSNPITSPNYPFTSNDTYGIISRLNGAFQTEATETSTQSANNAHMYLKATWSPDNGDLIANPAPPTVTVNWKRHIVFTSVCQAVYNPVSALTVTASAANDTSFDTLHSTHDPMVTEALDSGDGGLYHYGHTTVINPEEVTDSALTTETLNVVNGIATKPFTMTWTHTITGSGRGEAHSEMDVYFLVDFQIATDVCQNAVAVTPPAPHPVTGSGWTMNVAVSDRDGLVLTDVKLNVRYMAKKMSLPYYWLSTTAPSGTLTQPGELRPNDPDTVPYMRSRLVSYQEGGSGSVMTLEAVYLIDKIGGGCLLVTQRYEFYATDPNGCDGSIAMPIHLPVSPCNRFKPIVKYQYLPGGSNNLNFFRSAQRLFFKDHNKPAQRVGVFRDCDSVFCIPPFRDQENPLYNEMNSTVILNGADNNNWDNYHQTYNDTVSPPPITPPGAGCPECVHMHWRWSSLIPGSAFGSGHPLIPPGSHQTVEIGVVNFHPDEEHPTTYDWHYCLDGESLIANSQDIVLWYDATGTQVSDQFLTHGGFFWPTLPWALADLADTQSCNSSTATSGQILTFTIRVPNHGPADVTTAKISEVIQGGTILTAISSDLSTPVMQTPNEVHFNISDLGASGSVTLTITVRVTATSGSIISTSSVNGFDEDDFDIDDPDCGNNVSVLSIPIGGGGSPPGGGGSPPGGGGSPPGGGGSPPGGGGGSSPPGGGGAG